MTQPSQDFLSTLFGYWREIADDTTRCLGEEKANLFVELHSDALDILGALLDSYPDEERLNSLAFFEFTGLFPDLPSCHALFLGGKYRLLVSQLRFSWERIFRAWHADTYFTVNPSSVNGPPTLDDKHDWLAQQEGNLNWRTVIVPILERLFMANGPTEIESHFKPLWNRLNCCVHPSGELRDKLIGASALHLRDAFDETWAGEVLADTAEVFGLLWLATLTRFPAAVPTLLADPCAFRVCPQLRAALEAQAATTTL